MKTEKSIPLVAGPIASVVFNALWALGSVLFGRDFWIIIPVFFLGLSIYRLVQALGEGIVVNHAGLSGKIKKQVFHFQYHEMSAVNIVEDDSKHTLLLVAGYQSHSIRMKNASDVRDAILHNMAFARGEEIPAPSPTSVLRAKELSLTQKFKKAQKWLLVITLVSVVSFFLSGTLGFPIPFSSVLAYGAFDFVAPSWGIAIVVFYFLLWAFSKKWHFFFILAIILLFLEVLSFPVLFLFGSDFTNDDLFTLFFLFAVYSLVHIWVLFRLIRGAIFWRGLRRVQKEMQTFPMENRHTASYANAHTTSHTNTHGTSHANTHGTNHVNTGFVAANPMQNAIYQPAYEAIVVDDRLHMDISNAFRRENLSQIDNLFLLENIPPKKLVAAAKHFAHALEYDETAILFYDNSVMGSGKSGILLTNKCLYAKSDFEKPTKAYIKNIVRVFAPSAHKHDRYKIIVEQDMSDQITIVTTLKDREKEGLARVLNEAIYLLQRQQKESSIE